MYYVAISIYKQVYLFSSKYVWKLFQPSFHRWVFILVYTCSLLLSFRVGCCLQVGKL